MATSFNTVKGMFSQLNKTIDSENISIIRNNIKVIRTISSRLDGINKGIASTRSDFSRTAAKLAIKIRSSGITVNGNVQQIVNKIINQRGVIRGNMSTLNNTYVNEIPIVNMPQIIEKLENITKGINTKAKADANAAAKAKRNAVAKARANAAAKAKANAEEKNRAAIRDLQNKTRKQINETEKALYGNGANRRPTRTGGASRKLNRRVNAALAAAESIGNPTGSATSSAGSAASSP
jgi:hypothetical protein